MQSLFNRLFLLTMFSIPLYPQSATPSRFSLKTALEDTFLTEGLTSNVVAEIRTMGDSLTWFGTGQGLALHDGYRIYAQKISGGILYDGQIKNLVPEG